MKVDNVNSQDLELSFNPLTEFLDSNSVWTEVFENDPHKYTISSEATSFIGNEYFEVLRTKEFTSDEYEGTNTYIRTENNKVYRYNFEDEKVLYDFTLEVGDTFLLDLSLFEINLIVKDLDTIILLNGESKKRWVLQCEISGDEYTWIEGIGNIRGRLWQYLVCATDLPEAAILCLYQFDELVYDSPEYDSCWVMGVGTEIVKSENFSLHPNPTFDHISVRRDQPIDHIFIYNSVGELMYSGYESTLDVSEYAPGVYVVAIRPGDHNVIVRSFIKQ
ncbi:MAG: T9SS type A sorting domain-containing protein [Bacteroidota bacterium]|nr:T9SS type A sorting domain-containing protein [Bacteroidota bacterium]